MISNSQLRYWLAHKGHYTEKNTGLQGTFTDGENWYITDGFTCFVMRNRPDGIPDATCSTPFGKMIEEALKNQNPTAIDVDLTAVKSRAVRIPFFPGADTRYEYDAIQVGEAHYDVKKVKAAAACFGKFRAYCNAKKNRLDWLWIYAADRDGDIDWHNFAVIMPLNVWR